MKRGEPPQRRTRLGTDPDKARAWRERSAQRARERQQTARRAEALPVSAGAPPRPSKRTERHKPRRNVPADWTRRVYAMHGNRCLVTGEPADNAHHVVTVQQLVRSGLAEHAGDPRNGMPLTRKVHDEHHSRSRPVLFADLPASAVEFAAEHGLTWYLERTYPQ